MAADNSTLTYDPNLIKYSAFYDLAPLLALFGDEATKQFLATSFWAADAALLSIAPIGVPTIVVSAIRVGGNRWLKTFVGRARDSANDEEKELLSSTSAYVREIWDGHRIVRQVGPSKTAALILDEAAAKDYSFTRPDAPPLRPLDTRQSGLFQRAFDGSGLYKLSLDQGQYPPARLNAPSKGSVFDGTPPNLMLNIPGAVSHWSVASLFTLGGLVLQAAIMLVNAVVVYQWKLMRAGRLVAPYGYPMWIAGTFSLGVGTFICSYIVESSCRKSRLRPRKDKVLAITFFQKRIPEQNIPGYAIDLIRPGDDLHISRRIFPLTTTEPAGLLETRRKFRGGWTLVGTALALGGFVVQNLGTRQLHWSAGILQFVLTVIMVALRALLRRRIGFSSDDSGGVHPLLEKYEVSDWISYRAKHKFHQPFLVGTADSFVDDKSKKLNVWLRRDMGPILESDIDNPPASLGAVASALQAHSLLGECEEDADRTGKAATRCYSAMTAILEAIYRGKRDQAGKCLQDLTQFTYMMIAGDGYRYSDARGLVPIDFPTFQNLKPSTFDDRVRFLRAIIALTRHALYPYTPYIGFHSRRTKRIVGNYPSKDISHYTRLLERWIKPYNVWVRSTSRDRSDSVSKEWRCFFWGAVFSSEFHKHNGPDDSTDIDELVVVPSSDAADYVGQNIVLDLMSSFMLRMTTRVKVELTNFLQSGPVKETIPETFETNIQTLTDILVREEVCGSEYEAKLVIIPALMQGKLLHPPYLNQTWEPKGRTVSNQQSRSDGPRAS